MPKEERYQIRLGLASLVLFREVLREPVVDLFLRMLDAGCESTLEQVNRAAEFAARLLENGESWSRCLLRHTFFSENRYVRLHAAGEDTALLEPRLLAELKILEAAGRVTPRDVIGDMDLALTGAMWRTEPLDYAAAYQGRMRDIARTGYGIFAQHHMFLLKDGELVPVRNPDRVKPQDLTGYERERNAVMDNTVALAEGRSAANTLLYGDSGTGKSTCVKSVANALHDRGVRLIELRKEQLDQIPYLIDRLCVNPLKFILFIDDLSFTRESDHYASLKAILEGSVSAKTSNMVIYATSNRRHLIRETFSDREGDDIHLRDTMEELGSLSDRFGLLVTFLRPEKELYLEIAERYCKQFGVEFDTQSAEAFALRRGGRSARAARQFAESCASRTVPTSSSC